MTGTGEEMKETPDKRDARGDTSARDAEAKAGGSAAETGDAVVETRDEVIETREVIETGGAVVEKHAVRSNVAASGRRANRTALVVVALFAAAALALLLWWLARGRGDGAGRVVTAPRNVGFGQPESPGAGGAASGAVPAGEATLTVAPDAAARAGLKVEAVGEQLAPEAASRAAAGVVQPNAYRSTPVLSLVGGRVASVAAEAGQFVRKGQTVAVVLSEELAAVQSKYLSAQAELEEHHKHHHRTAELVEIGAASREEFEQSTAMLKKAEAELASERQRLLLLGLSSQRVAALRSSSQVSSEIALAAPVSGTVVSRAVNPGEVVEANKELLRVADLSNVWVVAQVFERDLARVVVGSGASVTSDAYPGRVFRGRVAFVDPQLDPATRTAQVRVEIANPSQALKLGMFVGVAFGALGTAEATAPTVPASAVQNIDGRTFVFLATADASTYVMRAVRLGSEASGRFPVIEGLAVGDRVVTQGSFMLRAEWLKLHPEGVR
ncbi:MAG TPA: efflux RND transporter periplasmic adaptor subunit [Pyrinomonadaceae bacterium]|nr:efflux RND transporter periplasmic adaptor subunit [Pyrinomonadaceae bacterium]